MQKRKTFYSTLILITLCKQLRTGEDFLIRLMIFWNFFNRASISGTSKPALIASCKVCTVQGNDGSSKSLIASCWLEALSAIIAVTLFVMLYCLKTPLSFSEMLRPVCASSPNGSVSNTTLF